jgi:hypothetical protein
LPTKINAGCKAFRKARTLLPNASARRSPGNARRIGAPIAEALIKFGDGSGAPGGIGQTSKQVFHSAVIRLR